MNRSHGIFLAMLVDSLRHSFRSVVFLAFFALSLNIFAANPTKLGDLDGDSQLTVFDLTKLRAHIRGTATLPQTLAPFADITGDGFINEDDSVALINTITGANATKTLPLASIRETSPFAGESNVSLTREVVVRFTMPLSLNAVLTTWDANAQKGGTFYAEGGGRKLLTRVELSGDRTKATLFFLEPIPASTRITVTFNDDGLRDLLERQIDPEADGTPAGVVVFTYDTAPITAVPGTGIIGHVYASEKAANGGNSPLAGALVRVVGSETLFTHTAADGSFNLTPCPAGRFFVEVDGRECPVSHFPDGGYYPYIVKAWETLPGKMDNLAAGTGLIYLPLVPAGTLKPVSATNKTIIGFAPSVVAANPAYAGVEIYVPPNSLFADDGTRGGKVGLAPVASDRLPEPLPPGLHHALDISIQTDGATNFDRPVPVKFPNLPDPVTGVKLKPGEKSALWSYNHDKGRWEIAGPMTVTDDGNFLLTDVGVGVRQPGWHGANPGTDGEGPKPPPEPKCKDTEFGAGEVLKLLDSIGDCLKLIPKTYAKVAKFFKVISETKDVYNHAVKFKRDIEAGRLDVLALRIALEHWKLKVAELKKDLIEVTPLDQLRSIIGCAKGLLDSIEPFCKGAKEMPECFTWLGRQLCGLRAALVSAITEAERAITIIQDALFKTPFALIDAAIAQLEAILNAQVTPPGSPQARSFAANAVTMEQALNDLIAGLDAIGTIPDQSLKFDAAEQVIRIMSEANGLGGDASISANGTFPNAYLLVETEAIDYHIRADAAGYYRLILPPNQAFAVHVFDPATFKTGKYVGISGANGSRTEFRGPALIAEETPSDRDVDGLSDVAEAIIGTIPTNPDSDGDGVLDGAEIIAGSNPLNDVAVATGVLSTIDTPGQAKDIVAQNTVALLADGSEGVSVFNVANALNPVRTAQVRLSGSTEAVALDGTLAAATGSSLSLLDLSDLSAVRVTKQLFLGGTPRAVTAAGGVAYTGLDNGQVVAVDLAAGAELERLQVSTEPIHDLSFVGDVLYARSASRVLAIEFAPAGMTVAGSVAIPGSSAGRQRLFAGVGVIYAPKEDGYTILSLADPLHPAAVQTITVAQRGWRQFVPTGSGLGLGIFTNFAAANLHLYDIGANGTGSQFLTTFTTPGDSQAVSIFNGLAYVADGDAGLTVVNYKAYDALSVPPTISIRTGFPTVGGALQAEEGKLGRVSAQVADDVQVRNVEFYVDGQLAVTDGNFPFEHRFTTPLLAAGKTSFTLRAKATDTGGNATFSNTLVVNLVADATPPRVVKFLPPNGALTGKLRVLSAVFSEPINQTTLNSTTFALTGAGPDGLFGTADDITPTGGAISYREGNNSAFLNFAADLVPGLYRLTVRQPLADLAGNPIAADSVAQVRVFGFSDRDGDGVPDDVEPLLGLNPDNPDSDGDGIRDGQEDFDNDGLINTAEIFIGTDPTNPDTNNNGIKDGLEDADGDKLNNIREFLAGTDPNKADTDGDGWNDETEVTGGSNPLDPKSRPIGLIASMPRTDILRIGDTTSGLLGASSVIARPPVFLARTTFDPNSPNGGLGSAAFIAKPTVYLARTASSEGGPNGNTGSASVMAQPIVFISRLSAVDGNSGTVGGASIIATPSTNILRLDISGLFISKPTITFEIQQ